MTAAERLRLIVNMRPFATDPPNAEYDITTADIEAGADALDRLAQTCGNCQHADIESAMAGWVFCAAHSSDRGDDRYRFPFAYRPVPLDERCKGWTKRDDA